jgi:putative restriction endonuclease
MKPFIANTDAAWFRFLAERDTGSGVDEVNFWQPRATRPMKQMVPGEPVFFRLKRPHYAIAGYGFFAHFQLLGLEDAWSIFGWKNGDPYELSFLQRIGKYRNLDLLDPRAPREPIGCTVLREARFWPEARWIPWGQAEGWAPNIVQGKTENDLLGAERLLAEIQADNQATPDEFTDAFQPLDVDQRDVMAREMVQRYGQGTFRLRVLGAYQGRCAITGEHTQPVLDAAHIQPYLGPKSNHVQKGLLLTKEFHSLFDRGYVTVTPDYEVHVSTRLRRDWNNGHRYYPYDGRELLALPTERGQRPSLEALDWHARNVFLD